jgi:hypothetical protein
MLCLSITVVAAVVVHGMDLLLVLVVLVVVAVVEMVSLTILLGLQTLVLAVVDLV